MVLTASTMLPLGTPAPDFVLPDVTSGEFVRRDDFATRRALVVIFLCNHCPYVQHVRAGIAAFGRDYADEDVGVVGISPNDVSTHPQDGPDEMAREAREQGYVFPYLYDESQEVAKAYTAACTPDFFVFDAERELAYRGQFDGARPGNDVPVTGDDLREALDCVLAGRPVSSEQRPSLGCNIKWKAGKAPRYFSPEG